MVKAATYARAWLVGGVVSGTVSDRDGVTGLYTHAEAYMPLD